MDVTYWLIALFVLGIALYLILLDAGIKKIIYVIVAVVAVLLLWQLLLPGSAPLHLGR